MENMCDAIELFLPFKAEYVSTARLLASGVANRIGFDIETIEDIKVAISEVCSKLVQVGSTQAQGYKMIFRVFSNRLEVIFDCEDKSLKCIFGDEDSELGVSIINALMDEVELCSNNDYLMMMSKGLEGNN